MPEHLRDTDREVVHHPTDAQVQRCGRLLGGVPEGLGERPARTQGRGERPHRVDELLVLGRRSLGRSPPGHEPTDEDGPSGSERGAQRRQGIGTGCAVSDESEPSSRLGFASPHGFALHAGVRPRPSVQEVGPRPSVDLIISAESLCGVIPGTSQDLVASLRAK
jgi:hypothetical protein